MGGCNTGDESGASEIVCRPNSSVNEVTGSFITGHCEDACAMCKLDIIGDAGDVGAVGGGRDAT